MLRANNINLDTRSLVLDDIKVVSYDTPTKPQHRLRKGDILICAGSGSREHVGKTAYISEDTEMLFGGFMGVLRTNESVLNSRYLFHVLGGTAFRDYLGRVLASSTINNLNASIMNTFPIPVPPMEEQRRIVEVLDAFSALTAELEGRRKQYAYYRELLLFFPQS